MFVARVNKKLAGYLTGVMLILWGVLCILPAIASFLYSEIEFRIFVASSLLYTLLGITLVTLCKNYSLPISKKDGQISVGVLWFSIPMAASLPYMFFPENFSLLNAIFESFSGFTTTGSTVITDLDSVPRGLLLYRALTQWIGGLGFTLLIIAALRNFQSSFTNLFNAEFFSIATQRLYPRLTDTVKRIFVVYILLTISCFVLLCFGDMTIFEALCHSLTTISTGGFTTSNENIGGFSIYSQMIIVIFMLLSAMSYLLVVNLFRGRFAQFFKNEQLRWYLIIIFLTTVLFVIYWTLQDSMSINDRLRGGIFYSVSIISSTGFDLQNFSTGYFVSAVIILLMFVGGCSASSATGLKVIRLIILLRFLKAMLVKNLHPKAVIAVKYNQKSISDENIARIFGFFFLYLALFMMGIFVLCICGNDFQTSMALSIANLGNIGPVVGGYVEGFSYASINVGSQITLIALMLAGRLEIYTFFALFSKSLWSNGK